MADSKYFIIILVFKFKVVDGCVIGFGVCIICTLNSSVDPDDFADKFTDGGRDGASSFYVAHKQLNKVFCVKIGS